MAEIKYTSDNKKVVVVGKLNSVETIVQEIFVKEDGSEIPSGEQFVVKSLHDEPIVSWKQKELKNLENRYDTLYESKNKEIKKLEDELKNKTSVLSAKLSYLKDLERLMKPEDLQMLTDFLSGNVKYLIIRKDYYNTYDIVEFNDEISDNDDYKRFENLKLITLYGSSKGDLKYRINRYSDGSSSSEKDILYANSYDEALIILKGKYSEIMSNEKFVLSKDFISSCEKYNIEIPKDMLKKYYNANIENINRTISEQMKGINNNQVLIDEYNKKINML